MPRYPYHNNPALRPTVLVDEVMKTVYRPAPRAPGRDESAAEATAGPASDAGDEGRAHPRAA